MSDGALRFDIPIEGLETLTDALVNAPQTVDRALEDAGRDALIIASQGIETFTPIDTGWLIAHGLVEFHGLFTLAYTNFVEYAPFVEADQQFVERGIASVQDELEQVYDAQIDQMAADFGRGF